MTVRHHISDELLLSYAAGSLAEGWSLVVATHLALCPHCRGRVRAAEAVGGYLLESAEVAPLQSRSLTQVMERIERVGTQPPARLAPAPGSISLPEPLRSYVGGDLESLKWRRLGLNAYHIPIETSDPDTRARLMRFSSGVKVPRHGHKGREITLVLSGSLHDGGVVFRRGDVEEADESVEHTPTAGLGEGCVCLAITDAPLQFNSWVLWLLRPFLAI